MSIVTAVALFTPWGAIEIGVSEAPAAAELEPGRYTRSRKTERFSYWQVGGAREDGGKLFVGKLLAVRIWAATGQPRC